MLAYYSMAVTACRYSSYFRNSFFTSTTYLINDKQRFVLFPSASNFGVYMPTQDFHLLQNVLLIDAIIFNHKTDSFILTYSPFKHQINKIFLLVVLTSYLSFYSPRGTVQLFKCLFGNLLDFFSPSVHNIPSQLHNIIYLLYYHDHHK